MYHCTGKSNVYILYTSILWWTDGIVLCTGQSYVSILSHCPTCMWDSWDSSMVSHVYHCTGKSHVGQCMGYSRHQKKVPVSVPVPFRSVPFCYGKTGDFFPSRLARSVPFRSVPFRSVLSVRLACFRAHVYNIKRSTDRSIEREASAEFSSRLKQERTVRSYQKTT